MNPARSGLKTNRTSEHRSGAALVLCVRQRRRDSLITCLPLPLLRFSPSEEGANERTSAACVMFARSDAAAAVVIWSAASLPPSPSRNENWAMFPHPHMLRRTDMLYFQYNSLISVMAHGTAKHIECQDRGLPTGIGFSLRRRE